MKKLLLLILLCIPILAKAQFRWADTLVNFSSQYTSSSWAAVQALGIPDTYPSCGDITTAWASATADNQREFLELGFSNPGPINRIRIYETNAPGAIDTVYIWNPGSSTWVQVYSATATAASVCPFVRQIYFPLTSYNVTRIRIAVNSPAVSSWNEIDAVSISNQSNNGMIGTNQTICNNYFRPDSLISIDSAFQDSVGVSYQWQRSNDSLAWANISGATGLGFHPDTLNQTTYFRRKAVLGANTVYSNVIKINVSLTFTPQVPGVGAWILYGYNGADISLNPVNVNARGYYVDSSLSFSTFNDWNSSSSPSSFPNWQGCSVTSDLFTMSAVRTGFPAGFYTFQMPSHDDPGQAFKNGQQIFYDGGCCGTATVFNIGYLKPTDTIDARFAEYYGGAGMSVVMSLAPLTGGSITSPNAQICLGDSISFGSSSNATGGQGDLFGNAYHYQWQDSLTSGSWITISGATQSTYQTHAIFDTAIYFRRKVTDDSSYVAYSNVIKIQSDSLHGNPAIWGINQWRFYAYNGRDLTLNPSNVVYRGYYTDTALNFNTQNEWDAYTSPSTSIHYLGCPVQYDAFSMSMKRIGFPAGPYVISFPTQDDDIQVFRNGVLMLSSGCCGNNPFASLGGLGPNDTLEYRYTENYGPAFLSSYLRQQNLDGGAIAGDEYICGFDQPSIITNTVNPSGGYAPTTITYQWQDSISGGTWVNIPAATGLAFTPDTIHVTHGYRRLALDSIPTIGYSNTVIKTHSNSAGNPTDTGNNIWNVYGYQGTNINLTGNSYRGYYLDSNFSINTIANNYCNGCAMNASAGWQGCQIGADQFTSVWRRRGFPAGQYSVNVYHDDDLKVLKNGTQVYYNGCCPSNTINLGFLNSDSVLEMRLVEYGGGNFLIATFVKTDSAIADYRNTNCNNFSLVNVSGTNWWDFTNDSGQILASINPNGNNLGTVTVSMKHYGLDSAHIPVTAYGVKYMPRYFNLESSNYPAGNFPIPVNVRLYYKDPELDTYMVATGQPGLNASNLVIYHYDGVNEDCDINNNSGPTVHKSTSTSRFTATGFYLQATIPSFSELGVAGGSQALPVTLTQFDAQRVGTAALLNWTTASENQCKVFEIQRSSDAKQFTSIGSVNGQGVKLSPTDYSFTDEQPLNGRNYYRLLQQDVNGQYQASGIKMVDMGSKAVDPIVAIYPNPATDIIHIRMQLSSKAHIRMWNAAGNLVYHAETPTGMDTKLIPIQELASGVYLVQVEDDNGGRWQQRVTKK